MTYTTTLMDKLEKFKNENPSNDTVHDDVAAQAYVEQFALDTFNRADTAIRTNKATACVSWSIW
jgi:vacuolar protein sorting-associated protein VTA1